MGAKHSRSFRIKKNKGMQLLEMDNDCIYILAKTLGANDRRRLSQTCRRIRHLIQDKKAVSLDIRRPTSTVLLTFLNDGIVEITTFPEDSTNNQPRNVKFIPSSARHISDGLYKPDQSLRRIVHTNGSSDDVVRYLREMSLYYNIETIRTQFLRYDPTLFVTICNETFRLYPLSSHFLDNFWLFATVDFARILQPLIGDNNVNAVVQFHSMARGAAAGARRTSLRVRKTISRILGEDHSKWEIVVEKGKHSRSTNSHDAVMISITKSVTDCKIIIKTQQWMR